MSKTHTSKAGEKSFFQKDLYKILISIILLLAAFLRLYRIGDYMTFLGDEGRDVLVAYNILHGKFTLLGPTASVGGFFLGPIYYYFMASFLWLFHYDPSGPAAMIGLFGVATVWLVYKIGSEFFNKPTGIIAAALYAVSPLVIGYSRSSWNPNPMPFFTLLTLYLLYRAIVRRKKILFLLAGLFYGICMQLHYIEVFVGVVIAIYLFLATFYWEKTKSILIKIGEIIKRSLLLTFGFLIGFSPFLAFEARHGFVNLLNIFTFIFHSPDTGGNSHFFSIIFDVFFRLFARLLLRFQPLQEISLSTSTYSIDLFVTSVAVPIIIFYVLTLLLALTSLSFFFYKLIRSYKDKSIHFLQNLLIAGLFLIGIFLFGFYKKTIYDYYFEFLFPIPFLLVGLLLAQLITVKGRLSLLARIIGITVIVFLLVENISRNPFRFTPNRQKDQVKTIADFVLSKSDGKPFNFALIANGNSDHAYRYFFKLAGKDPIVIENFAKDPKRTSVTNQLLVVCEFPNCRPLGYSLWEVAGFGRAEITGQWHVSVVDVYKLIHYKGS